MPDPPGVNIFRATRSIFPLSGSLVFGVVLRRDSVRAMGAIVEADSNNLSASQQPISAEIAAVEGNT